MHIVKCRDVRAPGTCEHSEHVKSPYINHIKRPVLLSMCARAWMTNTVGIRVHAEAFIERMCHGPTLTLARSQAI